jgi:hypothetical protein
MDGACGIREAQYLVIIVIRTWLLTRPRAILFNFRERFIFLRPRPGVGYVWLALMWVVR